MVEISDEKYEELRLILEKQNGRIYTFEEAKELGNELIEFFILLSEFEQEEIQKESSSQPDQRRP